MNCRVCSTALAVCLLAVAGYSHEVKADTFTVTVIQDSGNAPVEGVAPPNDQSGYFTIASGSSPGMYLSPYAGNSGPSANTPYNLLSGGTGIASSATYNLNGANFFDFLWGSPDTYNAVTFYSAADGLGSVLGSFTGADLSCFSTVCQDTGFALTQFIDTNGSIGSVVLSDPNAPPLTPPGHAAFEFGTAQGTTQLTTPLPGALALFAGGLALLGFTGRRRRNAGHRLPVMGVA